MATSVLIGVDIGTSSAKGAAYDPDGRCLGTTEIAYRLRDAPPRLGRGRRGRVVARDVPHPPRARRHGAAGADRRGRGDRAGADAARGGRGGTPAPSRDPLARRAERGRRRWRLAARVGPEGERVSGNRSTPTTSAPSSPGCGGTSRPLRAPGHDPPIAQLPGASGSPAPASPTTPRPRSPPRSTIAGRARGRRRCARRMGVDPAWLPEIKPSHAIAGGVTAAAARETGLREGTPVAVGGADFAASTLAAGVTEPGEACLMLGTAGNLIMPLAAPDFDTRLINSHHVGCDRYLALGGTLSGALQEWFRSVAAPGVAFETLDAEAAAVPGGRGRPAAAAVSAGRAHAGWDAGARGAFVGLSLVHGRGHLYRAVLEGVAVSFRHCAEIAAEKRPPPARGHRGERGRAQRGVAADPVRRARGAAALRARRRGRPRGRRAARGHGGGAGARGWRARGAGAAPWCGTRPTRRAHRDLRALLGARRASSIRRSARSPDGAHHDPRGRLHGLGPHRARDRQRPRRRALGHPSRRPPDRGGARGRQASQARPRAAPGGDRARLHRAAAGARGRRAGRQRGHLRRRAPGAPRARPATSRPACRC